MSDLSHPPEAESLGEALGVTEIDPRSYHWLEACSWCRRKHVMYFGPCAACGGAYGVGQPVSEKVQENCGRTYQCDGCDAYEDS